MKLRISEIKHKQKPTKEQYFKIVKSLKSEKAFKDLSLRQLAYYIGEGHSIILANYNKTNESIESISREHIKEIQLLTLDIETEKKIDVKPMPVDEIVEIIHNKYGIKPIIMYNTFSHTEEDPRARLIYFMKETVTVEEYEHMLTVILNEPELVGRIDSQCKNSNRIWQGTNKEVFTYMNHKDVGGDLIQRLLTSYKELKPDCGTLRSGIEYLGHKGIISDIHDRVRIKYDCHEIIRDIVNNSIDIVDFLQKHFDLRIPRNCNISANIINCNCPIHRGSNEKGFAIYRNTNTAFCFGDCQKKYDIMQLGYYYYNNFNFNNVALTLIEEYNLPLDERWIDII